MNPAPEETDEDTDTEESESGDVEEDTDAPPTVPEATQAIDTTDTDAETQDAEVVKPEHGQEDESQEEIQETETTENQEGVPPQEETQEAEATEPEGEQELESPEDTEDAESQPEGEQEGEAQDEDVTDSDENAEEEEAEEGVYRKHGFRGRWEDPSAVASEAQRLYAGDHSTRPIRTSKSFRLIKIDRKRAYRGDIYLYGADRYSYERQNATRIGRSWIMRWAHTQSFFTPLGQPRSWQTSYQF